MDLLSNIWAVGVSGSLISGFLVMFIIRCLFSARRQREYHQNLAAANHEILHAIRPAIAERIIPSNAMLDALFSATARKHGVDSRDLLPKAGFANELIKEVIDDPFLSSQQKVAFGELLAGMKKPDADPDPKWAAEPAPVARRASASDPSGILGLSTALLAFTLTLVFYIKEKEEFVTGGLMLKILPVLAIVCIIQIIAFLLLDLTRPMTRPRRESEEEKTAATNVISVFPTPRDLTQLDGKPMPATP